MEDGLKKFTQKWCLSISLTLILFLIADASFGLFWHLIPPEPPRTEPALFIVWVPFRETLFWWSVYLTSLFATLFCSIGIPLEMIIDSKKNTSLGNLFSKELSKWVVFAGPFVLFLDFLKLCSEKGLDYASHSVFWVFVHGLYYIYILTFGCLLSTYLFHWLHRKLVRKLTGRERPEPLSVRRVVLAILGLALCISYPLYALAIINEESTFLAPIVFWTKISTKIIDLLLYPFSGAGIIFFTLLPIMLTSFLFFASRQAD